MHPSSNAFEFLISLASDALLLLFLLRMFAERFRVDFNNPLSQVIYRYSNPVIKPLRQYIHNYKRWNLACVLLSILVVVLKWIALLKAQGQPLVWQGIFIRSIGEAIDYALFVYMILVFAWAISSFLTMQRGARGPHPAMQFVDQLVTPVMRPFQRHMPNLGGIDFSPTIAIIVIILARMLIAGPIIEMGAQMMHVGG